MGGAPLSPSARVAVGALVGVAWAGALRAYMAELGGGGSHVSWSGTFLAILLPGALVGAALATATGGGSDARSQLRMRWLAASPLLLGLVPLARPGALTDLLSTGIGGFAIGIALAGVEGGYAWGGGGRRWLRIALGVHAASVVVGVVVIVPLMGGSRLALSSPRGAWVATLGASLMVLLYLACALPFRELRNAELGRRALAGQPAGHSPDAQPAISTAPAGGAPAPRLDDGPHLSG